MAPPPNSKHSSLSQRCKPCSEVLVKGARGTNLFDSFILMQSVQPLAFLVHAQLLRYISSRSRGTKKEGDPELEPDRLALIPCIIQNIFHISTIARHVASPTPIDSMRSVSFPASWLVWSSGVCSERMSSRKSVW